MNEPNARQLTACQKRIASTVVALRKAIDERRFVDARPDQQASIDEDVCLTSRSAYFDFYTWTILNGMLDEAAATELDQLFRDALHVISDGEFKRSVIARYDEFRDHCYRVRAGRIDEASSIPL